MTSLFKDLEVLGLLGNKSLLRLPIRLIGLPHFTQIYRWNRLNCSPTRSLKRFTSLKRWRARRIACVRPTPSGLSGEHGLGVQSLVVLAIRKIVTDVFAPTAVPVVISNELPSHLAEFVTRSYACDVCKAPQVYLGRGRQKSLKWMANEVDMATGDSSGRDIILRGRICVTCCARVFY